TVAVGSTNFHGVELTIVGEPVVIDHTDLRTYEYRVRMENVSVPNAGPPADRNSALVAAWNSARVIKGEAKPPRMKIEWIEFESPFYERGPPTPHANILFAGEGLDDRAYAREVLQRSAPRAYRGPPPAAELERLKKYGTRPRATAASLEGSLRETL